MHEPLQQSLAAGGMLQELYGLTNAEAQLVQALGTGAELTRHFHEVNVALRGN